MADAYLQQLSDPTMKEADFDDRLGMIIDIEYTRRKNNRLDRLIIAAAESIAICSSEPVL
jgi:hypothetical protein